MRFDWKEDDKYTPERLCEENNYSYVKNGNTYTINNIVSINNFSHTVYDHITDKLRKVDCKEDSFFIAKNIIDLHSK